MEIKIAFEEYDKEKFKDYELCLYEPNMKYIAVTTGSIAKIENIKKIDFDFNKETILLYIDENTTKVIHKLLRKNLIYSFVLVFEKIIKGFCVPIYIKDNCLPFQCVNLKEIQEKIYPTTASS